MRVHGGIVASLQHASTWAALAGLFAASSSQFGHPYDHILAGIGVGCGVVGILLRSPDLDKDDIKEADRSLN